MATGCVCAALCCAVLCCVCLAAAQPPACFHSHACYDVVFTLRYRLLSYCVDLKYLIFHLNFYLLFILTVLPTPSPSSARCLQVEELGQSDFFHRSYPSHEGANDAERVAMLKGVWGGIEKDLLNGQKMQGPPSLLFHLLSLCHALCCHSFIVNRYTTDLSLLSMPHC